MSSIIISFVSLLLISQWAYCQSYEQIALNFFADSVLKEEKRTWAYFDGKVNPVDTNYQSRGVSLIESYYFHLPNPDRLYLEKVKAMLEERKKIFSLISRYKFTPVTSEQNDLIIPRLVRKRKHLRYRKYTTGALGRLYYRIFPLKYNMEIEPAYEFNGRVYPKLSLSSFEESL